MRYLILLLTLLFVLPASAQVYRWVDDQGKVHYSDTPPPSEQAEALNIDSGERVPAEEETAADEKTADEIQTPIAQTLAEKRCELAKITLATYREVDTLVKADEEGNKQALSDEEKAAAIKQAEANVAARCNTGG
ncbi:MAG TPA: DUF4124 domain-containing protein [Gammaproteobacteria bacterium]|nr:DUF4124 domain-containing protein [Gammaproteobacteria bacterium]